MDCKLSTSHSRLAHRCASIGARTNASKRLLPAGDGTMSFATARACRQASRRELATASTGVGRGVASSRPPVKGGKLDFLHEYICFLQDRFPKTGLTQNRAEHVNPRPQTLFFGTAS